MIARGVSNGAVCLGCRLRLLQQVSRPGYVRPASRSIVLTRRQIPRWFASESAATSDAPDSSRHAEEVSAIDELQNEFGESEDDEPLFPPDLSRPIEDDSAIDELPRELEESEDYESLFYAKFGLQESGEKKSEQKNDKRVEHYYRRLELRKTYRSKRRVLNEAAASLGSDMLGEPAYAIVMKDGGLYKKRARTRDKDASQGKDEPVHVDLGSLLHDASKPLTPEDVRAGIDSLRPKSDVSLSQRQFKRIQKQLEEGFLVSQLQDYLQWFKAERENKKSKASIWERDADDQADETPSEQVVAPLGQDVPQEEQATPPVEQDILPAEETAPLGEQVVPPEEEEMPPVEQAIPTADHETYPWIKNVSPWVPLGSIPKSAYDKTAAAGIDRHLYGYTTPSARPKEQLAVRIMRECWGLHIEQLMAGLGETLVKLRNHEFVLLMRGTRRFLRVIMETFLGPGETIEAFRNKLTLRIITARPNVQTIIEELNRTFTRIKSKTFPVKLLQKPEMVTDELLDEVGRITNSVVQFYSSKDRIRVTWLESDSRQNLDVSVEDLRHAVFRLLYTAINPPKGERTLHALTPADGEPQGRYMVDGHDKEKWAWKDKLGEWSRYVLPALRPKPDEPKQHDNPTVIPPDHQTIEVEGPFKNFQLPIETQSSPSNEVLGEDASKSFVQQDHTYPNQPVRWSPTLETRTAAVFGYILHSHSPSPPPLPALLVAQHPRIFNPVMPHPVNLASFGLGKDEEIVTELPISSEILIKLIPAPATDTEPGPPPELAPPLELRLSLSTTEEEPLITGIHSLRVLTANYVHDVLLPSNPVDIRFTQSRYATLLGTPSDIEDWQPLYSFFKSARLDLRQRKLEFPPQQKFFIEPALLDPLHKLQSTLSTGTKKQKKAKSNTKDWLSKGPISILYEFAGLELHRSVTVPYADRFSLTYTSIEAGQGGGRRAELSLRPVPASASASSSPPSSELNSAAASIAHSQDAVAPNLTAGATAGATAEEDLQPLQDDYLRACYDFARNIRLWSGYR